MKKTFYGVAMSGLLVLFLLSTLTFAQADNVAYSNDSFSFRGIPWGSNFYEANAVSSEQGLVFDEVYHFSTNGDGYCWSSLSEIIEKKNSHFSNGFAYGTVFTDEPVYVAGIETEEVHLYFAYTLDNEYVLGTADRDLKHTKFMMGSYYFRNSKAFSELLDKLITLYGYYDTDFTKGDYTYYYWHAQDGSFICLRKFYSSFSRASDFYIFYGNTKYDYLMAQNMQMQEEAAVQAEKERIKNNGFGGL